MTESQLTEITIKNQADIAVLQESNKSAHKRIDDNERVANSIYDLSNNLAGMTVEMKAVVERMEESERRRQAQGERIGALEQAIVALSKLPEAIERLSAKVEHIEKEPAVKWKELTKQITSLVIAAVVGAIIMRLTS